MIYRRLRWAAIVMLAAVALVNYVPAWANPGEVKITDQPYVRHDGGSDSTIADCSSDATTPAPGGDGSGARQQNEPSAAIDPSNTNHMVAGANDYCTVQTIGGNWAGFYYSSNGGASWTNSLLPGYPTDTSSEGQASPLFGQVNNAGDPVQAWDNNGHLYYAGIAFNRARPARGSIWVARYNWPSGSPSPDYLFTRVVARGTPSPLFLGLFHDKVMIEVDRGASSPFAGNVYVCWARFTASSVNNGVFVVRSSDGGQTWSNPMKVSESIHGSQFCDVAVTKNGTVFVAWRQFQFMPDTGQAQKDAVAWVKSTDGGRSFTKPQIAAEFIHWDVVDRTIDPLAADQAARQACLAGDAPLGGCAGGEVRAPAGDCGDGPFACQSGYVFHRMAGGVRITADPTAAGDPDAAYVVFEATVPGTQTPTGTTYGTVSSGVGSQGSIYFIHTANGGATWSSPSRIDAAATGHQYFPDIDANAGKLHVVYHDSRVDTNNGPPPPASTGDFRTVAINNDWVSANPPGGIRSTPNGLETRYATAFLDASGNPGAWTTILVSLVAQMPQYEMFGNRDIPFHGDYNYISAVGTKVLMAWADTRDVVAGTDPRYTPDGADGFDVHQCRVFNPADGTWSADNCPNFGGLNQNIYGFVLP